VLLILETLAEMIGFCSPEPCSSLILKPETPLAVQLYSDLMGCRNLMSTKVQFSKTRVTWMCPLKICTKNQCI